MLYCLVLTSGYAQDPYFINYTVNQGLPSSENYYVLQDSKGYVWVAGDAGVSKFDGYNFKTYTTENGLVDNTVFGMCEDSKGNIWYNSLSGKIGYHHEGKFYSIPANDTLSRFPDANAPQNMTVDPSGNLYLNFKNLYCTRIRPPYRSADFETKRVESYVLYLYQEQQESMVFGYSPKLWSQTNSRDFNREKYHHVEFLSHFNQPAGIIDPVALPAYSGTVRSFGNKEEVYLSIANHLYLFRKNKLVSQTDVIGVILALMVDSEGNLWVGTSENGIFFFPKGIPDSTRPTRYFLNESVSHIMEDRQKGIWFTSLKNGLFYIPYPKVVSYRETLLLDDSKVTSVTKIGQTIVAGKSDGEILLVDSETLLPDVFRFTSTRLATETNIVNGLKNLGGDTLMVLSHNTYFLDVKKKKVLGFLNLHGLRTFSKSVAPFDKKKFIAASSTELFIFDRYTGDFLTKPAELVLPYSRINAIQQSGKKLWIASTSGLWTFTDYKYSFCGDSMPVLRNRMDDVKVLKDGRLVLATKAAGIIILDWQKKKYEVMNTHNLLPSNTCKKIFVENDSMVWVCTNKGLSQINLLTRKVKANYTIFQGLSSNETNQAYIDDKKIWVATTHGLTCIQRSQSFYDNIPPPVYITGMEINDKESQVKNGLQLKPGQYSISIQFTGLSYQSLGKCNYKYRLEGLDPQWHYTNTAAVLYSSLAPGNYVFSVYALNNSGVSSTQPAVFSFSIMAPFWQKTWFLILLVIVFLLLVYAIFRIRLRRVKAREAKTAALDRALLTLKLKALRAQMNPHFTFNVMNSIQHFMLAKDEESAHRYLSKFAKLIRLILQHSEEEMITVADEVRALELYLELETMRFENRFTYEIIVDKTIDVNNVKVPSMLIQPYVENAVKHGIQPLKAAGKISIYILDEVTELRCVIEDNGVGRKAASKRMEEKGHRSFGTSITQERLSVINQINHLRLSEKTVDLMDAEGNAKGTRVEIIIPKNENKNHLI